MVRAARTYNLRALAALALMTTLAVASCGDETTSTQRVQISVNGWGPDDQGSETFVQGIPAYPGAAFVRVLVTQPSQGRVVLTQTSPLSERRLNLETIPFGQGLRLDMEVLDGQGNPLASGATPSFNVDADSGSRALRVTIMPLNQFVPAGAVFRDGSTGEASFRQSRMDYRGQDGCLSDASRCGWLGRVGHVAVSTSDGKVLIVGGADVIPGAAPGTLPQFRRVYDDVQLFDPETGYFSDLHFDEGAGAPLAQGADQLSEPRAYHTVTPLGEDRFLVIGGFTGRADGEGALITRPLPSMELIDLRQPLGLRVQPLTNLVGNPVSLPQARAYHSAHLLRAQNRVVVLGGVGASSDEILTQIDSVDLGQLVATKAGELSEPRVEHASVLLEDGTIWVMGGRNAEGARDTTELVRFESTGLVVTPTETRMQEPRFAFGATLVPALGGTRVFVVGGFTSLEGAVTGRAEILIKGSGSGSVAQLPLGARLTSPRGALSIMALPHSSDVLIVGGQDAQAATISRAERFVFEGLEAGSPFSIMSDGLGSFRTARASASTTLMSNGQVLTMGGVGEFQGSQIALDNAELYNPRDPVGRGAAP